MTTSSDDNMPRHVAYILRMWETRSVPPDPRSRWRLSLENVHTGEKHKFGDVESLSGYLKARMGLARAPSQQGESSRAVEGEETKAESTAVSIILVEEDDTLREQLHRFLEATLPGETIHEARDEESAEAAARLIQPDLMLVDVATSGDSGLSTLRRLRAAAPTARIVALGIEKDRAYEDQVYAAGADVYLQMWRIRQELATALQDLFATRQEEERERTVVCIEDEPDMISLIKLALERHQVKLVGALGGQEGLELVRRLKPDLVLLDLMMPDIHGSEVLRQMKADESMRDIPIIVITVLDRRYSAKQGLDLEDINGFIRKPFVPRELVETVSSTLRLVA